MNGADIPAQGAITPLGVGTRQGAITRSSAHPVRALARFVLAALLVTSTASCSAFRPVETGPRLRVAIATGCPARDAGVRGVSNAPADLADAVDLTYALLPVAAPVAGLVCRYHGLNGPNFTLASSSRLDARAAARLAAMLRPIPRLDDAVWHCPWDDASAAVIVLAYPGRPDIDLWYGRTGCRFLTNGMFAVKPQGAVATALDALAGPPDPELSTRTTPS